jgi:hypothetical protein
LDGLLLSYKAARQKACDGQKSAQTRGVNLFLVWDAFAPCLEGVVQYDDPKKPVFRDMNKVATKNKFRPDRET